MKANCKIDNFFKQAGTDPSRRHILGSKIAKGLQKLTVLVNWGHFHEKKFEKKVAQSRKN